MNYLTKEKYFKLAEKYQCINWGKAANRWLYHRAAIELLKLLNPQSVLEAGSLGITLCGESDTIDYNESGWDEFCTPTYNYDLRVLPWPTAKYDVFIALRVFHNLSGQPESYLKEIERISNHAIIAIPEDTAKVYSQVRRPTKEIKAGRTIILYYKFC